MSVPVPEVAVARVLPGLRAGVAKAVVLRTCAPDEPQTAAVEISEGFPAAFGAYNIMLASDRGTMEGPPAVAAGDLEFQRVDEFTFPRSGRLMYAVHGASNEVLESVPLTLTLTGNDEGRPRREHPGGHRLCTASGNGPPVRQLGHPRRGRLRGLRGTGPALSLPFASHRGGFPAGHRDPRPLAAGRPAPVALSFPGLKVQACRASGQVPGESSRAGGVAGTKSSNNQAALNMEVRPCGFRGRVADRRGDRARCARATPRHGGRQCASRFRGPGGRPGVRLSLGAPMRRGPSGIVLRVRGLSPWRG